MRVVLDTNILVSALIAPAGNPAAIYKGGWERVSRRYGNSFLRADGEVVK